MKKIQIYILIVVIVLIIAAGLVFIIQLRHNSQGGPAMQAQQNQSAPQPAYAPAGQLTPGLSKDMVLASMPQVTSSFAIPYGKFTQNTANFSTSDSVKVVYNTYIKYMQENKYSIVSSSLNAKQGLIYGAADQGNLSVQIDATKTGSNIILNYLKNK